MLWRIRGSPAPGLTLGPGSPSEAKIQRNGSRDAYSGVEEAFAWGVGPLPAAVGLISAGF